MTINRNTFDVDSGNFALGMVPDVIGADNSVIDLIDGWVERIGSIRKRGGKPASTTITEDSFGGGPSIWASIDWDTATPLGSEGDLYMAVDGSGKTFWVQGPLWSGGGEAIVDGNHVGAGLSSTKFQEYLVFGRSPFNTFAGAYKDSSWIKIGQSGTGKDHVEGAQVVANHDARLWVAATDEIGRVRWSHVPDTGGLTDFDENAFLDVSPGIGGRIVGLHSWNDQLVIVKETALFILRGLAQDSGRGKSLSWDLVSDTMGTTVIGGSIASRAGVFIFTSSGLFLFNGGQLVNLTDGVMRSRLNDYMSLPENGVAPVPIGFFDNPYYSTFILSVSERRLIVKGVLGQRDSFLIYDLEKQMITRQLGTDNEDFGPSGKISEQERGIVIDNENKVAYILEWFEDFTSNYDSDAHDENLPRLSVETRDIPAAGSKFQTGRPTNIIVSGYADSPMTVELLSGRDDFEDAIVNEYKFKTQQLDDVQRMPIGGVLSRPMYRVKVTQDDTAKDIRLYGIGLELLEDRTIEER